MVKRTLLVTGASGLIGSEVASSLAADFDRVYGVDNNMRAHFFGPQGDTTWRREELIGELRNYEHVELDIRDRAKVLEFISHSRPSVIVHCAAQPSHDLAARLPFEDFDVNAGGTLNLLEATRRYCAESPFVFMSTNKVYGDSPNSIRLRELDTRWDYAEREYANGIPESQTIDQSKHSLFGASKVAADVMVQEYGRYFNMATCCLRGGCLTGPNHSGVELHGFLSYLIKCNVEGKKYTVYGYKGKQVRDNIHAQDVAAFIRAYAAKPRVAEVYNIGGGRANSISILEAFSKVEMLTGKKMVYEYLEKNREGDHICYMSDLSKMLKHYPSWGITKNLDAIFDEIHCSWIERLQAA